MNHLTKAKDNATMAAEWTEKGDAAKYHPEKTHAKERAEYHRKQATMHATIAIAEALNAQPVRRRVHVPMDDAESMEQWVAKNGDTGSVDLMARWRDSQPTDSSDWTAKNGEESDYWSRQIAELEAQVKRLSMVSNEVLHVLKKYNIDSHADVVTGYTPLGKAIDELLASALESQNSLQKEMAQLDKANVALRSKLAAVPVDAIRRYRRNSIVADNGQYDQGQRQSDDIRIENWLSHVADGAA